MDKRQQLIEALKARALKAKAEGKTIQPMTINNPKLAELIERAKAKGIQPRPLTMNKMTREEAIAMFKNRLKKKEE